MGNECLLTCPKCHKTWAKMKYKYGSFVKAKDITITAGSKKKLKDGEPLSCSLCGYEHNNYDVMICISESGGKAGGADE